MGWGEEGPATPINKQKNRHHYYVQNHIEGARTRPDIPETLVDVDGIAETWFDDREAMAGANASPEAKRLHDDGALFIGRIKSFVVEEKFIIGSY
jgi:hypothetical protein